LVQEEVYKIANHRILNCGISELNYLSFGGSAGPLVGPTVGPPVTVVQLLGWSFGGSFGGSLGWSFVKSVKSQIAGFRIAGFPN